MTASAKTQSIEDLLTTIVASNHLKLALGIMVALFIAYLFFGNKDYRNPTWGVIVFTLGMGAFAGFIYAGYEFGRYIGLEKLGVFFGIGAFIFLGGVYYKIMTKKDKNPNKF